MKLDLPDPSKTYCNLSDAVMDVSKMFLLNQNQDMESRSGKGDAERRLRDLDICVKFRRGVRAVLSQYFSEQVSSKNSALEADMIILLNTLKAFKFKVLGKVSFITQP